MNKPTLTHAEIVTRAARWLRNGAKIPDYKLCRRDRQIRCAVVLTEFVGGGGSEIPDAIGWAYGGRTSVLVEAKASRADFLGRPKKVSPNPPRTLGTWQLSLLHGAAWLDWIRRGARWLGPVGNRRPASAPDSLCIAEGTKRHGRDGNALEPMPKVTSLTLNQRSDTMSELSPVDQMQEHLAAAEARIKQLEAACEWVLGKNYDLISCADDLPEGVWFESGGDDICVYHSMKPLTDQPPGAELEP